MPCGSSKLLNHILWALNLHRYNATNLLKERVKKEDGYLQCGWFCLPVCTVSMYPGVRSRRYGSELSKSVFAYPPCHVHLTVLGVIQAAAAAAARSLQSCLTLCDHRRQPTRLLCPWDSPGKNTGVGCHFLPQCMKVKVKSLSRARLLATPWTAAHQAPPSMGFSK